MKDHEALSKLWWIQAQLKNEGRGLPAAQLCEVIYHVESRLSPKPGEAPPGTVRVRIAVAVAYYHKSDPAGEIILGAVGADDVDDDASAMSLAVDQVCDDSTSLIGQAFVEADIPVTPTVAGIVKPETKP